MRESNSAGEDEAMRLYNASFVASVPILRTMRNSSTVIPAMMMFTFLGGAIMMILMVVTVLGVDEMFSWSSYSR